MSGATAYNGIPYARGLDYGTANRNNKYLSVMPDSTTYYKGDICHYLNSAYRMPYSAELGYAASSWTSYVGDSSVDTNIFGTTIIPDAANRNITMKATGMKFPASGYRHPSGGPLYHVGQNGMYWSSSAFSDDSGYCLSFNIAVNVGTDNLRNRGFSVRCVLIE
jgi:hypothetical protein